MVKIHDNRTFLPIAGLFSGILLLVAGNAMFIQDRLIATISTGGAGFLILLILSAGPVKSIDSEPCISRLSGSDWLIAAIVLAVSICCRVYLFRHFGNEIGDLNGRYLSVLWDMIHGEFRFPYLHWSMENDESLPVTMYLPVALLTRCDWPAIKLFHAVIFSFFPCFITVYLIRISGQIAGFTAGMILATSRYFIIAGLEVFRNRYALSMVVIIIAALLMFGDQNRRSIRRLVTAGCLIGLSFYLVSHCVPMVFALMIASVWMSLKKNEPRRMQFFIPGLVALLLIVPLIIYHYHHPDIAAHKADRFIWNSHDPGSSTDIIPDQIRNVLRVILIDAEGMRQAAHSVPFLPFPLPALAITGMILMIHWPRRPHHLMIISSALLYLFWLIIIDFRAYTSFYYEPFLLMMILSTGIGLQRFSETVMPGFIHGKKFRTAMVFLLIGIGIGVINIPIISGTPDDFTDLDLYGDMVAVFNRFPPIRGNVVHFDESMWDRTWKGTFHSFVFIMEKFEITPRFFVEEASGLHLMTLPEKREIFRSPEQPVFFMSFGNELPVPDAIYGMFRSIEPVAQGRAARLDMLGVRRQ